MKDIILIYITFPSLEEASRAARILVEENIIACANIIPKIFSVYKWEGKINNSEESVLIAKTASDNWNMLEQRVKELHPYECPCIAAMPITKCSPEFHEWVLETSTPEHSAQI